MNRLTLKLRFLCLAVIALMLFSLILGLFGPTLPAQASPGLPPRGQPPANDPPQKETQESDDDPVGAFIELNVYPAEEGLWAGVQWQDQQENWHEVEGWQGVVADNGSQRWWVAQKDFKTGPFRWMVRQGRAGPIQGISEPFTLPAQPEVRRIDLTTTDD